MNRPESRNPDARVDEAQLAEHSELPAELKDRVLAAVAARSAPPRGSVARQTAILTGGSWLVALAVFLFAGGVRVNGRPDTLVVGTAVGTGVAAAIAGWAALGRGKSTLGRARRLVLPIVVAAPFAILAWKILWSGQYEGALRAWSTRPGFRCLGLSLATATMPLIAFAVATKGSVPRHPVASGFAGGVAIGCASTFLTDLWCPVAYLPHILLGHLLPTMVLGAVGALLGRLVLAVRQ